MSKYFEVVTVTEGGADFDSFTEEEMIGTYREWNNKYRRFFEREKFKEMTIEEARKFITSLKVGDKFEIDGRSHGYVLSK